MRRFFAGLLFLCLLCTLMVFAWFSLKFFAVPIAVPGQPISFIVNQGQPLTSIAAELGQKGILEDPNYFLFMAKVKGHLSRVKAGEYRIPPNTTPDQLLTMLVKGKVVLHKVTFVEGWTFHQVMKAIKASPILIHTLTDESPEAVMASIGHAGENPEGLFYPDTYLFAINTKDTKVLHMAYDLMQKKLQSAWKNRSAEVPYKDPYEALIVASMVEKETARKSERPNVAGVILKRLQEDMRLQIDATVIYGAGNNYARSLTKNDLLTDTPYNTYTRKGLPPTPICMASISSIQAALHPIITDAIYYVARGDGTHVFSKTLKAHHLAVEHYLIPHTILLTALPQRSISVELMLDYWPSLANNNIFAICPLTPDNEEALNDPD